MINSRGNQYSKTHQTLDSCPGCADYWNFTHHDSALEDYTTTIDYIVETTNYESMFFVGYSMGTTQYLILLSEKPEYNAKIKAGFLLAPTAYGGHATNPMTVASPYAEAIVDFISKFGIYEFMPNFLETKTWLANTICNSSHIQRTICGYFYATIIGMEPKNVDTNMAPIYLSHMPAGTNLKTMLQMGQMFRNGDNFYQFDYGPDKNMKIYGSTKPKEYNMSKVIAPTALIGGDSDGFCSPEDVEILANNLPNVLYNHQVQVEQFGHLDFIFGMDAKYFVYDKVIHSMNELR